MVRRNGEKVELWWALWLTALYEAVGYQELVWMFMRWFDCKEGAAKANISVLIAAGYLEQVAAAEIGPEVPGVSLLRPASDKRRRFYRVSERGLILLGHWNGRQVLALARKLFTRSPSASMKRFRAGLAYRYGSVEAAFNAIEKHDLISLEAVEAYAKTVNINNPIEVEIAYQRLLRWGLLPRTEKPRRGQLRNPPPQLGG